MATLVTYGDRLITRAGRASWLKRPSVPLAMFGRDGLALAPDGRIESFLGIYETQPWVAAAVNKLNRGIMDLPLRLYRQVTDDGEVEPVHSHPVLDGKMSCSSCHDPHKGPAVRGGGTSLLTEHDTCGQCHTAQRGPFVFEHEAVREGCTTCHDPHGTVNDKMLVSRNANLCLKCHFQQQTPSGIVIGGSNHGSASRLGRGTCWSAGCHEAVHGSQIGSSLRF